MIPVCSQRDFNFRPCLLLKTSICRSLLFPVWSNDSGRQQHHLSTKVFSIKKHLWDQSFFFFGLFKDFLQLNAAVLCPHPRNPSEVFKSPCHFQYDLKNGKIVSTCFVFEHFIEAKRKPSPVFEQTWRRRGSGWNVMGNWQVEWVKSL